MTPLSTEQTKVYNRFIRARNKLRGTPWVRQADVVCTVDIEGMNHPLFEPNDDFLEYKEASLAWWAVEPRYRDEERMRSSRGDYGSPDNWEEKQLTKEQL